jgi:multicomponent Na+:H+ antiporter subunit F
MHLYISEGLLLFSVIAVLSRLFIGPTVWDRLLAYNSATNRVVALLAIAATVFKQSLYLDVAVVYAALSFLGVVILARFMERGEGYR